MFGVVHSPGAGIVWHGSFMEDGCLFPLPFLVSQWGGASTHVKSEVEEEEYGGEREGERGVERDKAEEKDVDLKM